MTEIRAQEEPFGTLGVLKHSLPHMMHNDKCNIFGAIIPLTLRRNSFVMLVQGLVC